MTVDMKPTEDDRELTDETDHEPERDDQAPEQDQADLDADDDGGADGTTDRRLHKVRSEARNLRDRLKTSEATTATVTAERDALAKQVADLRRQLVAQAAGISPDAFAKIGADPAEFIAEDGSVDTHAARQAVADFTRALGIVPGTPRQGPGGGGLAGSQESEHAPSSLADALRPRR
ncbi:hypothetical protein AADG42_05605 [Ammonicoccus fulvus]|uniref:Scaffolding protein n=1 Tax=Ammonicoccus fulvus TaxID=3138240 RepID=A0ABZ3FN01_9ACTN